MAFLIGAIAAAAWVAIAVDAYRRAVRRRTMLDLPGRDGGAIDVLWLAPVIVAVSTAGWALGGGGADPGSVLDRYLDDWRAGREAAAAERFVTPPLPTDLDAAWARQLPLLRNRLLALATAAGPDGGIDAASPLTTVRWVPDGAVPRLRRIRLEVVRRETERSLLLGFLPTSAQRSVPVGVVGTAVVAVVTVPSPTGWGPTTTAWRILSIEIEGESIGR